MPPSPFIPYYRMKLVYILYINHSPTHNPLSTPPRLSVNPPANNPNQVLLQALQNPPPRPQPERPECLPALRPNLRSLHHPQQPLEAPSLRPREPAPTRPRPLLVALPPSPFPSRLLFLLRPRRRPRSLGPKQTPLAVPRTTA